MNKYDEETKKKIFYIVLSHIEAQNIHRWADLSKLTFFVDFLEDALGPWLYCKYNWDKKQLLNKSLSVVKRDLMREKGDTMKKRG